MKNPVREHGASSMEKAIYTWGLIANGRRWSAPKTTWPFIPARESALGRAGHAGFFTSREGYPELLLNVVHILVSILDIQDPQLIVFLTRNSVGFNVARRIKEDGYLG